MTKSRVRQGDGVAIEHLAVLVGRLHSEEHQQVGAPGGVGSLAVQGDVVHPLVDGRGGRVGADGVPLDRGARAVNEFVDALRDFGGPAQNFVHADTMGHIGYYAAWRIPLRKTGDGSLLMTAAPTRASSSSTSRSTNRRTSTTLPPASSSLQTIGWSVSSTRTTSRTTGGCRTALRIHDLLTTGKKLTAADFLPVQADTCAYPDVIFTSEVVKLGQPFGSASEEWDALVEAFSG